MDKLKQIKINPNTVVGTVYSQIASVTVTDIDVTIEFAYINPRNPEEGIIVSRVTMPKNIASDLANVISLTIKKHDTNISKKN